MSNEKPSQALFWGCFIALITTAFAFITRAFLVNDPGLWPAAFGLDNVQSKVLFGHGIWPFAISIIIFSLIIDKIGYRVAMVFSFVCYALYAALALVAYNVINNGGEALTGEALKNAQASAYNYLVAGSIILGLGNGTVEAFINPVVATMFNKDKTKWLNILHAGWPGGLVLGGLITLALGSSVAEDWRVLVYMIALPSVVYLVMLIKVQFPVNERVASGVSYRQMLGEFGMLGALIAFGLIFRQLQVEFKLPTGFFWGGLILSVGIYGFYCKSLGRPILIILCLIMMPLATTELGTDEAITGIMRGPLMDAGWNGLWVLIYTSAIMCFLRFFAGPIVNKTGPLGLLSISAALACVGLFWLSTASGLFMIFAAATLYAVGKTFFWPTILGVVAEQTPKGGAMTLNGISGIGMLTVGIIGGPWIAAQTQSVTKIAINEEMPGIYETVSKKDKYVLGVYDALDQDKLKALPEEQMEAIEAVAKPSEQKALAHVAVLPIIMLICFLALAMYFKSKGGYKVAEVSGH
ncbi:MFS transporter [Akkermansiaceae bacterium]|nr:MFS transporter [Akkermansiaceae bacterium]MDA7519788.1 MFS transporter [bacterium]MDB4041681.1 MFS transporter [Akkermansiaceae bacterium]MDB4275461.1 MFS transporter [Akkermansiaceae bacterium]MDB4276495.1 MFS transporter [Akkermansiaceae bacterium]